MFTCIHALGLRTFEWIYAIAKMNKQQSRNASENILLYVAFHKNTIAVRHMII